MLGRLTSAARDTRAAVAAQLLSRCTHDPPGRPLERVSREGVALFAADHAYTSDIDASSAVARGLG
jgi:hypothetical protein